LAWATASVRPYGDLISLKVPDENKNYAVIMRCMARRLMSTQRGESMKNKSIAPASWLGIGIAMGLIIGLALDNISIGLALGVAIGAAMMAGASRSKKQD
jgi:hypothetical protein